MAKAAAAEKSLQEAEQKLAAIAVIAQEAEAKLTAAQRAKADAELQLADKMEQLANINLDLTALNNLDPKVISQQTSPKAKRNLLLMANWPWQPRWRAVSRISPPAVWC